MHVRRIRELFEAGVTDVMIHSAEANQRDFIEWYGRNVLPHVRLGQGGARSRP